MSKESEHTTERLLARLEAERQTAADVNAAELAAQQFVETDDQIIEADVVEAALALRACMVKQYDRHARGRVGKAVGRVVSREIPGFRLSQSPDQFGRGTIFSWQTPLLLQGDTKLVPGYNVQHGIVFGLDSLLSPYDQMQYGDAKRHFNGNDIHIYEASEVETGERELDEILTVKPDELYEYENQERRLKVIHQVEEAAGHQWSSEVKHGVRYYDFYPMTEYNYDWEILTPFQARKDEYTDYSHVRQIHNSLEGGSYISLIGAGVREQALTLMRQGLAELQS